MLCWELLALMTTGLFGHEVADVFVIVVVAAAVVVVGYENLVRRR